MSLRRPPAWLWATSSYLLVVAGITGPWFARSGYIWLLDSVWGPHQRIVWSHPTMNLAWQLFIAGSVHIFGSALTEKLLISALLLASAQSAYYLARAWLKPTFAWAAGLLYLLNPFAYERLLGGQWIVLAGYALLPAALAVTWHTLGHRGTRYAYRLIAILAVYPLISPHCAYIFTWLAAAILGVYIFVERPRWLWRRRTLMWLAAALGAFGLVNWFWLISPSGEQFQAFSTIDFATFRTASDPVAGLWGNVLSLYGFWHGRAFIEPKDFLGPTWLLVAGLILALAIAGAVRAVRERSVPALTLAIAAPVALTLAAGYTSPLVRPLTIFLLHYLPGYRGLRDSAKLLAVPALAFALLAPYGAEWLAGYWRLRYTPYLAAAFLALLAAMSVTGIWASASHQVPLADYPADWSAAAAHLQSKPSAIVAVLPWHNHVRLSFAGNAYVGQPAPIFLSNPTLSASEDDNILAARPSTSADRLMLGLILGRITPSAWAARLHSLGVKYVWLEKTDDWPTYYPLLQSAGLTTIYNGPDVALYRL